MNRNSENKLFLNIILISIFLIVLSPLIIWSFKNHHFFIGFASVILVLVVIINLCVVINIIDKKDFNGW